MKKEKDDDGFQELAKNPKFIKAIEKTPGFDISKVKKIGSLKELFKRRSE